MISIGSAECINALIDLKLIHFGSLDLFLFILPVFYFVIQLFFVPLGFVYTPVAILNIVP